MWSGRTMRQRLAERDCVMVCLPLFGGRLTTALQGRACSAASGPAALVCGRTVSGDPRRQFVVVRWSERNGGQAPRLSLNA